MRQLKELAKTLAFRYTPLGRPTYPYCLEPIQLAHVILAIERLKQHGGRIVEIGVARGLTTYYLAQHLINQGLTDTMSIMAIDTFTSFVPTHLAYETTHRGKANQDLNAFTYNDFGTWKRNFQHLSCVKPVQADCTTLAYESFAPILVAILDVDLYLPTKDTLPSLYYAMIPGGLIMVDDCKPDAPYDGAYQAYIEFCADQQLAPTFIGTKGGLITKQE